MSQIESALSLLHWEFMKVKAWRGALSFWLKLEHVKKLCNRLCLLRLLPAALKILAYK